MPQGQATDISGTVGTGKRLTDRTMEEGRRMMEEGRRMMEEGRGFTQEEISTT